MFRRWGDRRAVIGRVESKGLFLGGWDLKDNKQPAWEQGERFQAKGTACVKAPRQVHAWSVEAQQAGMGLERSLEK